MQAEIPGQFSFPGLLADDYAVNIRNLPHDSYIDDISYGGISILHEPLRIGRAIGLSELRITIAADGGLISAKVTDNDGKPVSDCYVVLVPAAVTSDAALAAALVSGQTDQNGTSTSRRLAPGKYYVLASTTSIDLSPESIGRLSRALTGASAVEVNSNATVQVSLSPMNLE